MLFYVCIGIMPLYMSVDTLPEEARRDQEWELLMVVWHYGSRRGPSN